MVVIDSDRADNKVAARVTSVTLIVTPVEGGYSVFRIRTGALAPPATKGWTVRQVRIVRRLMMRLL